MDQIRRAEKLYSRAPFIVYLQAGSGTYAPIHVFRKMVDELCGLPGMVGLFVGTRPDCVDEEVLDVLAPWEGRKLLWLELGLQSSSDRTLTRIGRGHGVEAFVAARGLARDRDIPVCAHVILGLPGEEKEDMMATAAFLAKNDVEGVKLHHLQIIRGAGMEDEYMRGEIATLDFSEYPAIVADFLENIPPWTVVHRLLADAPEDMLIAPRWPEKIEVVQAIRKEMLARQSFQGRSWKGLPTNRQEIAAADSNPLNPIAGRIVRTLSPG